MELKGDSADKWEQVREKTRELADAILEDLESIDAIKSDLKERSDRLNRYTEELKKLSNAADKEVLREESGMLNDDAPEDYSIYNETKPEQKAKIKPEIVQNSGEGAHSSSQEIVETTDEITSNDQIDATSEVKEGKKKSKANNDKDDSVVKKDRKKPNSKSKNADKTGGNQNQLALDDAGMEQKDNQ